MAFDFNALALLEVANLILSAYLMIVIFQIGVKTRQGLFSKALKIIFVAVALIFVAYLLQFFYPLSSDALQVVFTIGSLIFLGLLVFAIHEIKRDLLGQMHLSQRGVKGRPTYVD